MRSLALDPQEPARVFAGADCGICLSTDGGAHFRRLASPADGMTVWSLAIDPANPKHVFAGTGAPSRAAMFHSADGGESWIILGDLSALYDLAAPWILDQLAPGNRRIVVINNGGGKIFAKVPSLRRLPEASRAIIENRHTLTFAPWAELWSMAFRRATHPDHLRDLPDGPVLIEVIPQS